MRRSLAAIVLSGLVLGLAGGTAAADSRTDRANAEVTGTFSGRQTFQFNQAPCSFVRQVFDVTFTTAVDPRDRTGTLVVDVCVTFAAGAFAYDGTFSLTTARRSALTGTVVGTTDAGTPASLDLVLTVTGGTGRFRRATGTIVVDGTWANDPGVLGAGPTSGTLTGRLSLP